jgi:hypothetical protein
MGKETLLTQDKPRASRGVGNGFTPHDGDASIGMNAYDMNTCIHPAHGASYISLFPFYPYDVPMGRNFLGGSTCYQLGERQKSWKINGTGDKSYCMYES